MLKSKAPKECQNCLRADCISVFMSGDADIQCKNLNRMVILKEGKRFFLDTREEVPEKCPYFLDKESHWTFYLQK